MSIMRDIRAALEARAITASGFPAIRSYDGFPATRTTANFAMMTLIPTGQRDASLGSSLTLHQGLFLITVYTQSGGGAGALDDLSEAIRDVFTTDVTLTSGDASVRIRYAERGPTENEEDWIRIQVSVSWFCHEAT